MKKINNGYKDERTVKKIFNLVSSHGKYKKTKEELGAVNFIEQGIGDCIDYSDLFVASCRAKRIPARVVTGVICDYGDNLWHAWAEVYLNMYGWVRIDPTFGDNRHSQLRDNRFRHLGMVYMEITNIRNDEDNKTFPGQWISWGDTIKVEQSVNFIPIGEDKYK